VKGGSNIEQVTTCKEGQRDGTSRPTGGGEGRGQPGTVAKPASSIGSTSHAGAADCVIASPRSMMEDSSVMIGTGRTDHRAMGGGNTTDSCNGRLLSAASLV